jgi:hypothetical protein
VRTARTRRLLDVLLSLADRGAARARVDRA